MFKSFSRLNIGSRLILSHGCLLLITVLIAGWCMAEYSALGQRMSNIVDDSDVKIARSQRMLEAMSEVSVRSRTVALFSVAAMEDQDSVNQETNAIKAATDRYAAAAADFAAMGIVPGREAELWKVIESDAKKTFPLLSKAVERANEGSIIEASKQLSLRAAAAEKVWRENVQKLIKLKSEENAAAVAEAEQAKHRAISVVAALVAMALVLGALLARSIAKGVTRPIDQVIEMAERIASGDLATNIMVQRRDEVGRLQHALVAMQTELRSLVAEIRQCADSIQTASTEVAIGNQDLSVRTESAASNLQAASRSLAGIVEEISTSADSAKSTSVMAVQASRLAAEGGQLVTTVNSMMQSIQVSSGQIGDITNVINSLAMQTRLLALNAAVEAARAGDYGRGFSVVASEVRNLANRSAEAAKEIGELIAGSTQQVADGVSQTEQASTVMGQVVKKIQQVAITIDEIQATVTAQSVGLGAISNTTSKLDEMTQQNAALVEESTAAAELLREQAHRLTAVVARFKSGVNEPGDDESIPFLGNDAPLLKTSNSQLLVQ